MDHDAHCTVCLSPDGNNESLFFVDGDVMCGQCRDELTDLNLISHSWT